MKTRTLCVLLIAALFLLTGCWDYRGLNQMTIVAGLAVDESETNPGWYTLTFEIVDTDTPSEQGQVGSRKLVTEGATIFEAIHNSNKQLNREMYFGNMDVLIISQGLAAAQGIDAVMDAFLRDTTTREDLMVLISKEKTAGELIEPKEGDNMILAYKISEGLRQNYGTVNSTNTTPFYAIYDTLAMGQENLALPAMGFLDTEKSLLRTDGMAVFKGDKLITFLTDDNTPPYMFAMGELQDGTLVFDAADLAGGEEALVTVSILQSKPTRKFSFDGETLEIHLHIEALSRAVEVSPLLRSLHTNDMRKLEEVANRTLSEEIARIIGSLQSGSGADIFRFGASLYKQDPAIWAQVGGDWEAWFRSAKIGVSCDMVINDTGLVKEYKK
jgi:spore germination protein KC